MAFNDIATNASAQMGWKARVAAWAVLISTFGWSLISVGVATTDGTFGISTLLFVVMINGAEILGTSWALTPVLKAIVFDSREREKIKSAIQKIWGAVIVIAYIAEFSVVGLGTWEKLAPMSVRENPLWDFIRLILTLTITLITVFLTDFSLNVLMSKQESPEERTARHENIRAKVGLYDRPDSSIPAHTFSDARARASKTNQPRF